MPNVVLELVDVETQPAINPWKEMGMTPKKVARRDTMDTPGDETKKQLRAATDQISDRRNFAEFMREVFGPENGVDLELPLRTSGRKPPSFD